MSMTEILTLEALARYRSDLFDNLHLPTTPVIADMGVEANQVRTLWTITPSQFVDYLCFKSRGLCVAVANADWMKDAIGTWSAAHVHEWQRAFDTLFYKYNPIWNKDGTISRQETNEYDKERISTGNSTDNETLKNTAYTHGYNGGTVHSDDNLDWSHADKNVAANTIGHQRRDTDNDTGTSETGETVTEKGNIGVTTTQAMIKEEREIALYSIEDIIADAFIKEFCLLLW